MNLSLLDEYKSNVHTPARISDISDSPLLWSMAWDPYEQWTPQKTKLHINETQKIDCQRHMDNRGIWVRSDTVQWRLNNGVVVEQVSGFKKGLLVEAHKKIRRNGKKGISPNVKALSFKIGLIQPDGEIEWNSENMGAYSNTINLCVSQCLNIRNTSQPNGRIQAVPQNITDANKLLNALDELPSHCPEHFSDHGGLNQGYAHYVPVKIERDVVRQQFAPIYNKTGNVIGIHRAYHFLNNGYGTDVIGNFTRPLTQQEFMSEVLGKRSDKDTMKLIAFWSVKPFVITGETDEFGYITPIIKRASEMTEEASEAFNGALEDVGSFFVRSKDVEYNFQHDVDKPAKDVNALLNSIKKLPKHDNALSDRINSYFLNRAQIELEKRLSQEKTNPTDAQGLLFRGMGRRPKPWMPPVIKAA